MMGSPARCCIGDPQAGPPKLWSLWEMLQLDAKAFTVAVVHLQHAEDTLIRWSESAVDRIPEGEKQDAIAKVERFADACYLLPISRSLRLQLERFTKSIHELGVDDLTHRTFTLARMLEIKNNLVNELEDHLYLGLSSECKPMWSEPERWFGAGVVSAIPEAGQDIRDCVSCLCLEQWTASVYHAMGVIQHGIHWLASELNIRFTRGIEVENWKNIIDQIEKSIRALDQQPKTTARDEQLRFYSDLAHHFFYIKEAWRNHVMHARRRYDEKEARMVVDHVRQIMSAIAEKIWLAAASGT